MILFKNKPLRTPRISNILKDISSREFSPSPVNKCPTAYPTPINQIISTSACSSSTETFTKPSLLPCSSYIDSSTTTKACPFPMDKTIYSLMDDSSCDLGLGACSIITLPSPTYTPPGTPTPSSYELSAATNLPSSSNNQQPYSAKSLSKKSSSKISDIEDPELRSVFEENERNLLASLDKSFQMVKDSMNQLFAENA
jgi:hypothetical protein